MEVFDAVPPAVVRQIVEAAHLTASRINGQSWHFIVVDDRDMLRQLGGAPPTGAYVAQAPLAIAVSIERASLYAVADASRAIQSMILTA